MTTRPVEPSSGPSSRLWASAPMTPTATMMPTSQPAAKPMLAERARGARSIRIVAMIGTGLIAMPTAADRLPPSASNTVAPHGRAPP